MNVCSILVSELSTMLNLGIQLKNKKTTLQHYTYQGFILIFVTVNIFHYQNCSERPWHCKLNWSGQEKDPPEDSYMYVYQMGNSKKRQKVMVKYRFVGFCFI